MEEIMGQAHEFLRNFCLSNPQNQALLHKHLDLFLTPGVGLYAHLDRRPRDKFLCLSLSSHQG